jgi:hypothetical protein
MGDTRIGRRWRRLVDAVQPPTEARVIRDPAVEGAGRCRMHRPQNLVLANGVFENRVFASWLARERRCGERRHRELMRPDVGNSAMRDRVWRPTSGKPDVGSAAMSTQRGPGRPRARGGGGRHRQRRWPSGRTCTASSVEHPPTGVSAPVDTTRPFIRAGRVDGWCGDGHFVSKRLVSCSSEHGTGSQRARGVRQLVAVGKPRRKAGADKKPHEWQRSSRSQRGRGANRRGSEKLRGRNVPGEASPGRADPVTDVAEGAPEPQEGNRRLQGLWSAVRLKYPERAAQACGRRSDALWRPGRTDGGRPRGR